MLDLTQEQIADAQGLTAVHVNRTIQRLRGEGVITTLNRTVEVSDWKRLVDIADFDPTYLLLNEPTASQRTPELWSATGPMV
jgi:hypothetical protein